MHASPPTCPRRFDSTWGAAYHQPMPYGWYSIANPCHEAKAPLHQCMLLIYSTLLYPTCTPLPTPAHASGPAGEAPVSKRIAATFILATEQVSAQPAARPCVCPAVRLGAALQRPRVWDRTADSFLAFVTIWMATPFESVCIPACRNKPWFVSPHHTSPPGSCQAGGGMWKLSGGLIRPKLPPPPPEIFRGRCPTRVVR